MRYRRVGLGLAGGTACNGVAEARIVLCLRFTCAMVFTMLITGCADEPLPAPIATSDNSATLTATPVIPSTATPESVPTSQPAVPTPVFPPSEPSTPEFTSSMEDFRALLDQECGLSAGSDSVMVLPDVGSVGAGHTENLCFFLFPASITEQDVHRHSGRMQDELERVSDRLGIEVPQIIKVNFSPPRTVGPNGECPARGYFVLDTNIVSVLASPETGSSQIYGVAAHEFGHVVSTNLFGGFPPDSILAEGMATWLGSEAWLEWHGFRSLDDAVRTFAEEEIYIPLSESHVLDAPGMSEAECWKRRDVRYTQWAGFVGFLIDRYGMDAIEGLWSAREATGSDPGEVYEHYEVVLGSTLEDLESLWLRSIGVSSKRP